MVDRWLANDWVLRVLSLLLAIGIWANFALPQNPNRARTFHNLPVSVENVGHNKVQVTPAEVSVEISGPSDIVGAVQPTAMRVVASVPYPQAGTYRVTLKVDAPVAGTQVVAVTPRAVTVRLGKP